MGVNFYSSKFLLTVQFVITPFDDLYWLHSHLIPLADFVDDGMLPAWTPTLKLLLEEKRLTSPGSCHTVT